MPNGGALPGTTANNRHIQDVLHGGGAKSANANCCSVVLKHDAPKEVPTLSVFWPRFIDGHARANRQKPSGIAGKETVGRRHLIPHLG